MVLTCKMLISYQQLLLRYKCQTKTFCYPKSTGKSPVITSAFLFKLFFPLVSQQFTSLSPIANIKPRFSCNFSDPLLINSKIVPLTLNFSLVHIDKIMWNCFQDAQWNQLWSLTIKIFDKKKGYFTTCFPINIWRTFLQPRYSASVYLKVFSNWLYRVPLDIFIAHLPVTKLRGPNLKVSTVLYSNGSSLNIWDSIYFLFDQSTDAIPSKVSLTTLSKNVPHLFTICLKINHW